MSEKSPKPYVKYLVIFIVLAVVGCSVYFGMKMYQQYKENNSSNYSSRADSTQTDHSESKYKRQLEPSYEVEIPESLAPDKPDGSYSPVYLDRLWQNTIHPNDSVNYALFYLSKELNFKTFIHQSFVHWLKDSDDYDAYPGKKEAFKIYDYVSDNRTTINIPALIKTYRKPLLTILDKQKFNKMRMPKALELLNIAYYDLLQYKEGDEEEGSDFSNFQKVYRVMAKNQEQEVNDYGDLLDDLKPYISEDVLSSFIYDKYGNLFDYDGDNSLSVNTVVWAYSFWGRRYNEGTVIKAKESIDFLQNIYELDGE